MNLSLGDEVWLEDIYSTGIENLIQLLVLDDEKHFVYVITWNMELNREHCLYQGNFTDGVYCENVVVRSYGGNLNHNFNIIIEEGALINLETNVPCQLFDLDSEGQLQPQGNLPGYTVPGQRRVSEDRLKFLDLLQPGRLHHFISFADLLYWERFQLLKDRHELHRGKVTTFSPICRFPKGISVFHYFATNVKVLQAVRDAIKLFQNDHPEDPRAQLLCLLVLHRHPIANKQGRRPTPLHVSLEKQSPVSFDSMLELLVDCRNVCITNALVDRLDDIVNSGSTIVNDFLDNSFFVTDQYHGPRPLAWNDDDEEKIIAVPSAYLTDERLQELVNGGQDQEEDEAEEEGQAGDGDDNTDNQKSNGYARYSVQNVENIAIERESESNLKQVEAKVLDFDWVFVGENAQKFISTLADTENDEIFATAQVRLMIEFFWQSYYDAIMNSLFKPFIAYFLAFVIFATYLGDDDSTTLSATFVAKITCLVVFGKTFLTFLILEIIQFRGDPYGYCFDFWNILDSLSLILTSSYVFLELTHGIADTSMNILGSFALFMLYIKLFYWMRLFKPFSAFIRIVTEIFKDIQVFLIMLLICLAAFANVIIVLNANRTNTDSAPIFDPVIGFAPLDALIHAYLTGLGDFNKDNYSEMDSKTVWLMFFIATVLVQLVFMNMLIAIMGESFGRITAMQQQSTLKELCNMIKDHLWILKISEVYKNSRYILWLTPDTAKSADTLVERQIAQLKDYVEDRADQSDQKVLRQLGLLDEKVTAVVEQVQNITEKLEDE